jgi:outer membrane protein
MNNTLKVAVVAIALIFSNLTVKAQKTGFINLNDLLLLMPERKKAESDIQDYAKQLDTQLKTMTGEYENKVGEYQKQEAVMTDLVKADKQKELADLEERIKNFQQTAQESLQKKQQDLLEPMIKKAKKAIEDVSKENAYKQVFDTSSGMVLYFDAADDISELVKKKLSIGVVAPAPAANPAPKK